MKYIRRSMSTKSSPASGKKKNDSKLASCVKEDVIRDKSNIICDLSLNSTYNQVRGVTYRRSPIYHGVIFSDIFYCTHDIKYLFYCAQKSNTYLTHFLVYRSLITNMSRVHEHRLNCTISSSMA